MRKKAKKLSLNKTTLRRLDGSAYQAVLGAADGDDDTGINTCGCWTCKARSVCCLSQEPCKINSGADADGVG